MSETALRQLDAIHSMLSSGQRNLRVERHSLILWGLAGGGLFAASEWILTPAQLPDLTQRAVAWLVLLCVALGAVGYADWRLTRRVKAARDEAWSFIHRQVLKVWWLLMAMGVLLTFAMFFFGGGYMLYAAWLVLLGLGLYVHGLFSEELLEWVGVLTILAGVTALAARLPADTMRWLDASLFGIGLPLLACLLDRGRARPFPHRLAQSLGWLAVVIALPLAGHRWANAAPLPEAPRIPLAALAKQSDLNGARIVALPAGTAIPVEVELSGDVFDTTRTAILPLSLAEPLDLMLIDGQLSGDIRRPGEDWQKAREAHWISIPWVKAELTPDGGPRIRAALIVDMHGHPAR